MGMRVEHVSCSGSTEHCVPFDWSPGAHSQTDQDGACGSNDGSDSGSDEEKVVPGSNLPPPQQPEKLAEPAAGELTMVPDMVDMDIDTEHIVSPDAKSYQRGVCHSSNLCCLQSYIPAWPACAATQPGLPVLQSSLAGQPYRPPLPVNPTNQPGHALSRSTPVFSLRQHVICCHDITWHAQASSVHLLWVAHVHGQGSRVGCWVLCLLQLHTAK